MPDHDFDRLLEQAVSTVLENMFFTAPMGPADADIDGAALEARLSFHGLASGTLTVRISNAGARTLAASFLGEDENTLSDSQPGQLACELANMLCGWLVSKLEAEERFVLESPELLSAGCQNLSGIPPTAQQSFAIENGILTVSLHSNVPR